MRYRHSMRVPFGHADPARIAYYPRYFEWFHEAFESFFEEALGTPYADILFQNNVGFPSVQVACEYLSPVRFGDALDIDVFVSTLGRRSLTFEYRVRKGETICASASVKVVTVDMEKLHAIDIPAELRPLFAKYQESDDRYPNTAKIR